MPAATQPSIFSQSARRHCSRSKYSKRFGAAGATTDASRNTSTNSPRD